MLPLTEQPQSVLNAIKFIADCAYQISAAALLVWFEQAQLRPIPSRIGQPAAVEQGLTPAWALVPLICLEVLPIGFQRRKHHADLVLGCGLAGHCGGCCYGHPDGGQSVLMPRGVCCSAVAQAQRNFGGRVPLAGAANQHQHPAALSHSGQPMDQFSVLWVAGKSCFACANSKSAKSKPGATVNPPGQSRLLPTLANQQPAGTTAWNCSPASQGWRRVSTLVRAIWKMPCAQVEPTHKVPHLIRLDAVQRRDVACLNQKTDGRWKQTGLKTAQAGLVRQACPWREWFHAVSFGMAGQCQLFDERLCCGAVHGQKVNAYVSRLRGGCNDSRVLRRNTLIRLWVGSGCWTDQTPGAAARTGAGGGHGKSKVLTSIR